MEGSLRGRVTDADGAGVERGATGVLMRGLREGDEGLVVGVAGLKEGDWLS